MIILITGVGRCGTSFVARTLHEANVVCLGHNFVSADKWNPLGYYECADSIEALQYGYPIKSIHERYGCYKDVVGVKHPKICELSLDYLAKLDPLIILCLRARAQAIRSMTTFRRNKSKARCEAFYDHRWELVEEIRSSDLNVVELDFSQRRDEGYVLDNLKGDLTC